MRNRGFPTVMLIGVALMAGAVSTGGADAQECIGQFSLPFDVRWGLASLPAGDYSFTLEKTASGTDMVRLFRGTNAVPLIMSQSHENASSGPSSLTVVGDSAGKTVRDLNLPQIGMVLHYAPSKAKAGTAAEERNTAQNIPITVLGRTHDTDVD